jgi:hypothetical protein
MEFELILYQSIALEELYNLGVYTLIGLDTNSRNPAVSGAT